MLQAISFAVCRFCELQGQNSASSLNVHQESLERTLRTFRGFWRSKRQKYRPIRLDHICPLSQYFLTHSYFNIRATVFQQHRGASMGSQWAPIFCSAVVLLREWTFHASFRFFCTNMGFHHRYIDNRILIHAGLGSATPGGRLFWRLDFYTKPILLERVTGDEALGDRIDCNQNSITLQLPWNKPLRSSTRCVVSRTALSGLVARVRLILTSVYPRQLQLPQIQDLLGLVSTRDPTLLQDDRARKTIMTVIHKVHVNLRAHEVFKYVQ